MMDKLELKYLESLAYAYPTIAEASTEIINLQAILNLPKGTEHFLTDIHGEYEQFLHVLKNGSGSIRRKIDDEFGHTLSNSDKRSLASLIYYPKEKLELISKEENNDNWYTITLHRLIAISRSVSSKYTRSKVRKALPKDFAYIIEELLAEKDSAQNNKDAYYNEIINSIIRISRAEEFIIALCELIQRLVIDNLHIVGDIFDRGPGPHIILDRLMEYHSVDIQWGNHDAVWMGAAAGHRACIANVVRLSAKYGNLDTLEDGYGINLLPLANFAIETYKNDTCECFSVDYDEGRYDLKDLEFDTKMHKAIAVIQFKLEGQIIKRRPEFEMQHRLLLDKIDFENQTMLIDGKKYKLKDCNFPTIQKDDPYVLTEDEAALMERLRLSFTKSEKLQQHVKFLFSNGSLYKVVNSNLLYHGCVPLEEDGTFRKVRVFDKYYSGKSLFDILETYARKGYYCIIDKEERLKGQDIIWFIWSSENSPVYGKAKMATIERYLLSDKSVQQEEKNGYYKYIEDEKIVNRILKEFGLNTENAHIINGHMPVQLRKGETPVKCNGKVLVIDGGFSKTYQKQTGTYGYTLIFNSYGLRLVAHETFTNTQDAIEKETDIFSDTILVENIGKRLMVGDTDTGEQLKERIRELEQLLEAYRSGILIEKTQKK